MSAGGGLGLGDGRVKHGEGHGEARRHGGLAGVERREGSGGGRVGGGQGLVEGGRAGGDVLVERREVCERARPGVVVGGQELLLGVEVREEAPEPHRRRS